MRMFSFDNPGGEWLAGKRRPAELRAADSSGATGKMLAGAVTAWTREPVMVDVRAVSGLPGASGEIRRPGCPKHDHLAGIIERDGWDPLQDGNAIMIGVSHEGRAWIIEGNTRTAVAAALGVERIRAEIRWFNGAEDVPGPFMIRKGGEAPFGAIPQDRAAPDDESPSP